MAITSNKILQEGSYFSLNEVVISAVEKKFEKEFSENPDEPISFSLKSKDVKELIISPYIKDNTVIEYHVSVDGKQDKRYYAKTLRGLAKNLLIFASIEEDKPINTTIVLSPTPSSTGRVTRGVRGNEDLVNTVKSLSLGDDVKLVRIANNARNYTHGKEVVAKDEFAIEVRTMDGKSIGFVPGNHRQEPRIARKLVQHVPYTAVIAELPLVQLNKHTQETYVNPTVKINVSME